MIRYRILEDKGIVVVEPVSALSAEDFQALGESVDQYLEQHLVIQGLLIHARSFPGWESLAGLTSHIKFVRGHHKKIRRVALVTDTALGSLAQALAKHFVSAEIRHFPYSELREAMEWLENSPGSPSTS